MDRIIDKLKKMLALAERGEQGEAENARSIDWDKLMRILALSSTMEDVTFRKQISK